MKLTALPFILAVIIGANLPATAQQQAPTAEQCAANHRLWFSEFSDPRAKLPDSSELLKRSRVLSDCQVVDPGHAVYFLDLSWGYAMVIVNRYGDFVARHKLQDDMLLDDITRTRSKGVR